MKIRVPISVKLALSATILVAGTAIIIALQGSKLFEKSSRQREDSINISEAMARGTEVELGIISLIDKVQMLGSMALDQPESEGLRNDKLLRKLFGNDRDLVSLEIVEIKQNFESTQLDMLIRDEFLKPYNLNRNDFFKLRQQNSFPWLEVQAGEIVIRNYSKLIKAPLFTIGVPILRNSNEFVTHIAIADVRLTRLQKSFAGRNARSVYLIDASGRVLAHTDENEVLLQAEYSNSPLFLAAQQSELRSGQLRFKDPKNGEAIIGAFTKLAFGLTLIAQVKESVILEPSRNLRRESFYLTGILISVALLLIMLGSLGLTLPIERLVSITHLIAKGQFDVAARQKVRSSDEVGDLAASFDSMALGLKERDKVKSLFSKFHGSQVAKDLIGKDIALGGVKKKVTVFFSDIRGFTSLSEITPAEEVVDLLNAYFGIMVEIITRHGGIVDKFIGDAIMAVWGAPSPTEDDAYHAVYACLEMRRALEAFNDKLLSKGKSPLYIGMGLHSGYVISGTIGSEERMEYTVIGDTVNVASRIEASTKAFGTDLLISDATATLVGERFAMINAGEVAVKGKSAKLKLHKVSGYRDHRGEIISVKTRYSTYEAEPDAKVKVS